MDLAGGIPLAEFRLLVPEMVLAASGMAMLILSVVGRGLSARRACWLMSASLVLTAALVVQAGGESSGGYILAGMFIVDGFAVFWKLLFLVATLMTGILSARFLDDGGYRAGEYYALLLTATTGMLLMASGTSLLSIWISLELMALSSYILVGYFTREKASNEAAIKYFVLGALSSGIMLYGMSLLYGATGTVQLAELSARLGGLGTGGYLVAIGWLMLACGLFFKVAAVPFHIWTPDVYVGAPTPVTAFLSVASKAASFAILVRIFYEGLGRISFDWQMITAAVAVLTMIWGNLAAVTQTNVKRMLAYSSIAHAGYVLMGVLAISETGLWSVLFYLVAYTLMNLGAFGVVILLERRGYAAETYSDYAGLAKRSPALAAMMLIFMLALTGIPPTGGFFGKVYLFAAAVEAGWTWVAVVGVLMSAVSLYYYLGIGVWMYLKDSDDTTPLPLGSPAIVGVVVVCAIGTVLLGIFPGPLVEFARSSMIALP